MILVFATFGCDLEVSSTLGLKLGKGIWFDYQIQKAME